MSATDETEAQNGPVVKLGEACKGPERRTSLYCLGNADGHDVSQTGKHFQYCQATDVTVRMPERWEDV